MGSVIASRPLSPLAKLYQRLGVTLHSEEGSGRENREGEGGEKGRGRKVKQQESNYFLERRAILVNCVVDGL